MKKKTLFETLEEANSTSQQLDKKKLNKLLEDINPTEQRPTNSLLSNDKIKQTFHLNLNNWTQELLKIIHG